MDSLFQAATKTRWPQPRLPQLLIACGLALAAGASDAALIHWSLSGVTFSDGSTAIGSFDFDANTSTFSNVSITTSNAGTVYTTNELDPVPFGVDATGIELIDNFVVNDNAGKEILNLDFVAALTNTGGTVALVNGFPSFEGRCIAADCSTGFIDRSVTAGTLTSVPEPATLALLSLGLAGLGFSRRKQQLDQ